VGRTHRKESSLERRANKRVYKVKRKSKKFYQNTYYSDEEERTEEVLLTAKRNEDAKDV
tara:strand:- start:3769 stop:3945 length:177 start_codon:yes stop_codon:yes gene_type:complete